MALSMSLKYNMKHLITSGCSFTECVWEKNPAEASTWAEYLSKYTQSRLHNVAMCGAGNHIISSLLIKKVEELLNNGVLSKDIFVVVQWSGIFRFDKVFEKDINFLGRSGDTRQVHIENRATKKQRFAPPLDTKNNWVMDAGARKEGLWPVVYSLMSKEQAFLETLENILRVEWYLKSKKIKYKMFTGWDIFTDGVPQKKGEEYTCDFVVNSANQFSDHGQYANINHTLLKDNCKWFGYLFDMIDWDNFWTYESDTIKYGGLTQWVRSNLPKDFWFREKNDQHPSNIAHEQFAKQVLLEILDD